MRQTKEIAEVVVCRCGKYVDRLHARKQGGVWVGPECQKKQDRCSVCGGLRLPNGDCEGHC